MSFGARLHKHRRDCRLLLRRRTARSGAQLLAACALLWWALSLQPLRAQSAAGAFPEDAVKAVFLYRFAGYVQWPAMDGQSDRFVIAVLGADDVADRLRHLLPDHPVHGLPAEVHAILGLQALGKPQMLYIGPDYDGNLAALVARLRGRPILIVTDRDGALDAGSMVNFVTQGGHVRFEVSLAAARAAGLMISSDLLAVAQRVRTGDRRLLPLCAPLQGRSANCAHRVAVR